MKRIKLREETLLPNFMTVLKSWGWVIRSCFVNLKDPFTAALLVIYLLNGFLYRLQEFRFQTVNLFLPFIRLRFRTFRPLRVLILSKNPWVLLRRRLLGWYVLFIESLFMRVAYFLKWLNFLFKPYLLFIVKIGSQFYWQKRGFCIRFRNEI